MLMDFNESWNNLKDLIIEFRHDLHQYPELAMEEYQTKKIIMRMLKENGIKDIEEVTETGVVVTIHGRDNGPTIALRADIDGLGIHEHTGFAFESKREGYMHACGHDAHIAIAMGTLLFLNQAKENWAGCVKCVFQPAEERIGGAKPIIESGVLDEVTAIVALHVWPTLSEGVIGIKDGSFMASNDYFKITVTGKAAHGAKPNEGIDALYIGTKIVHELKALLAREVNPLKKGVINIGKFEAGDAYNIIPETAILEGTVRTLDPEVRKFLTSRIPAICEGLCQLYGAKVQVDYHPQYPVTVNSPEINQVIAQTVDSLETELEVITEPFMTAEDFSYYTQKMPGAMFLLGSYNEEKGHVYPLHHSKFSFDEEVVLKKGINIMSQVVLRLLK